MDVATHFFCCGHKDRLYENWHDAKNYEIWPRLGKVMPKRKWYPFIYSLWILPWFNLMRNSSGQVISMQRTLTYTSFTGMLALPAS